MTTEAIIESGMTFGPYPAGQCFYIEQSACYEKVQEGVHKDEWLPPLQDALSLILKPVVKSWALPAASVVVLNEFGAKQHGLILPAVGAAP